MTDDSTKIQLDELQRRAILTAAPGPRKLAEAALAFLEATASPEKEDGKLRITIPSLLGVFRPNAHDPFDQPIAQRLRAAFLKDHPEPQAKASFESVFRHYIDQATMALERDRRPESPEPSYIEHENTLRRERFTQNQEELELTPLDREAITRQTAGMDPREVEDALNFFSREVAFKNIGGVAFFASRDGVLAPTEFKTHLDVSMFDKPDPGWPEPPAYKIFNQLFLDFTGYRGRAQHGPATPDVFQAVLTHTINRMSSRAELAERSKSTPAIAEAERRAPGFLLSVTDAIHANTTVMDYDTTKILLRAQAMKQFAAAAQDGVLTPAELALPELTDALKGLNLTLERGTEPKAPRTPTLSLKAADTTTPGTKLHTKSVTLK